jgi:hypothetical protein
LLNNITFPITIQPLCLLIFAVFRITAVAVLPGTQSIPSPHNARRNRFRIRRLLCQNERSAMRDRTSAFNTAVFIPSPHLSDAVNARIVQSEIEGGVHLRDLAPGTVLEVRTRNRAYTIQYRGSGQALISGHPVFCPEPVLVNIHGSTWGGSMLKERYIGRGMCLEFGHPAHRPITTSVIVDVRESRPKAA